jgi:CBS-domain-containing membrane protein
MCGVSSFHLYLQGHMLSATVGVAAAAVCPEVLALGSELTVPGITLAAPLAVATAAVGMQATKTRHPPAGGTALIAVLGSCVGSVCARQSVLLADTIRYQIHTSRLGLA